MRRHRKYPTEDELLRLLARARAELLERQDEDGARVARRRRRAKGRSYESVRQRLDRERNEPW